MTGVDIAGVDGGQVALSDKEFEQLAGGLQGEVLLPGDAGWADSVLTWNAMVAKEPALVVRPASPADVVAAVRLAADHGLLLSVKGGGHNIAGTSIASGGLTLDMSLLRDVVVDPEGRTVDVGAGCLLKHVDAVTQEHGLATVLGFVSETGLAGLTLGGGFGYLTRRWGWTVDSLVAVDVVTPDGELRTASAEEHPDLFWALRGGGGNYGVVTRFRFRLYDVGPSITGGLIAWSGEHADEVLALYRDITASAPRELTAVCTVRLAPPAPFLPAERHGKPMIGMVVCHTGPTAAEDLAPIRGFGQPIADVIAEKPYVAQQSMLDATQPKGLNYYWKTEFVPELSDGFVDAFRTAGQAVTSPMSQSIMFHLAGALNERAEDDGAVGNRDAAWVTGFAGCWPPADQRGDEHRGWVRASWETIRPFSTGGNYVNFQLADDDPGRTAAAYRGNWERLQQVKATYDPHNLLRVNRNIAPGG